jgi:DNA-binding FadR family transcriptional regulator
MPAAATTAAGVGMFRRLRIEPAYKMVSAEIERSILQGSLPSGAPLPTEQELATRFGVHRSTVREAIRQVEQEGLLQRREGRRLFVCLPGLYDLAPRTTRMLILQQITFQELWDVAVTLEPMAAQLAARQASADDLDALAANIAATADLTHDGRSATQDDGALVELDVEFHALIGRASHNRALMLAREPVSLLYNPALRQIYERLPQSRLRNLEAHRQMLDALRQRDAQAALDWTHKHMKDFQRGFAMAKLDMTAPIVPPP